MKTKIHFTAHPVGIGCLLAALIFLPVQQLMAALLAITIHESAHLVAIWFCGVKHCSVEWTPLGFVAQTDGFSQLPVRKRMLIAIAGLLASAAMTIAIYPFAHQGHFLYWLFTSNLSVLLINALPVLPLDGGRVLLAIAALAGIEGTIRKILLFLSLLLAACIAGLGVYGAFCGVLNPILLVLGPYLAYAAWQYSVCCDVEKVQELERHSCWAAGEMFKADHWVSIGEPTSLAMIKTFRKKQQKRFMILHTIDPESGNIDKCISELQMIDKLLK